MRQSCGLWSYILNFSRHREQHLFIEPAKHISHSHKPPNHNQHLPGLLKVNPYTIFADLHQVRTPQLSQMRKYQLPHTVLTAPQLQLFELDIEIQNVENTQIE
jgi:hypothetical protein